MHELSITQSILKIALSYAEKEGAARIKRLDLVIGDLASVVDDSVQFYWEFITEGTIAAGSDLVFHRLPAKVFCQDCGKEHPMRKGDLACPICDGAAIKITAGTEFFLESIEIDSNHLPEDC